MSARSPPVGYALPPAGGAVLARPDADDALTGKHHEGQIYELSGPDALTWGEAVDEVARAAGRTIRYTAIDGERNREELVARGYPPEYAAGFVALVEHIGRGTAPARPTGCEGRSGASPAASATTP
ncbi:hypothetical protein [Nonomuraea dietziae]|uniref:hypothetical protein n=1 Tax=Nonomuraea dietziae TaxID=65515 RepID=UPI0033FC3029